MDTNQVDTLLSQAAAGLKAGGCTQSSGLDAEVLLAHVLGCTRGWLRGHGEHEVPDALKERYAALLARRERGEPLAYIVGSREFWSMPLAVGPGVLVPRPETELLVELALALPLPGSARVLDLGTGSGAIALALARERPTWAVCATDLSPEALAIAHTNCAAMGLAVELLQGSWLQPVAGRQFELIVSNPPYIATDDPALSDPALRHEPSMALTSGPDGLTALREIIHAAPGHLTGGGWLLLEHGATQAHAVQRELAARGLIEVRSHADLSGHLRVSGARRALST